MNKVIILGRLGGSPELRQTNSGKSVTSFSVAVDRPYSKDKEKETDWIDCVAWQGTAEFICRYFEKGSPISLVGTLQSRTWEKDGQKHKAIEVLVENVEFVPAANAAKAANEKNGEKGSSEPEFCDIEDEDLPF